MHVTSTAFADGGAIPTKYTHDGAGVSPPLAFSDVPPGTKSLALSSTIRTLQIPKRR